MSTQTATKPSLTLKRRLNAPPAKVYAAWTEPADDRALVRAGRRRKRRTRRDRSAAGGRYTIVMHVPAATSTTSCGVYREVVPNEKLVFTWAWKSTPEREVARHGHDQAGWRGHAAHPDA